MPVSENSYGTQKRLDFIRSVITEAGPESVLDIGCGTGLEVTIPLAREFPEIRFMGADSDVSSIEFAQSQNPTDNVSFSASSELQDDDQFDLIIASEVIEHVEHPLEFLLSLKKKLSKNGKMILTLPNGYGPFEVFAFIAVLLQLSGIFSVMRSVKRMLLRAKPDESTVNKQTLANSPHINFFSYKKINTLIAAAGFDIKRYRPRTFLCGFVLDNIVRGKRLVQWNARIADSLPPQVVSDWMFELEECVEKASAAASFECLGGMRSYLNRKNAGLLNQLK